MANPWTGMGVEFEMRGARVVAIVTGGGGAIVEEGLDLSLEEGRVPTFGRGEDDEGTSSLAYHGGFYPLGKSPGDTSEIAATSSARSRSSVEKV